MSEAAVEEVSVLSSVYCAEGEFRLLQQSVDDGLVVQINSTVGEERRLDVSLSFHLHPCYPSSPPNISVSSTALSRTQCHDIRQKLLDQAAVLPPEPMVHQLVEWLQVNSELTDVTHSSALTHVELPQIKPATALSCVQGEQTMWRTSSSSSSCVTMCQMCVLLLIATRGGARGVGRGEEEEVKEEQYAAVLLLDHIRSHTRYIGLLERWTQQLQLTGRLLLGRRILVILQGVRASIKEFCRLLKTVKVDVDSSGKKCKERMMKVLIETPSSSPCGHGLQGFVVKNYQSSAELTAAFQELSMTQLYQQISPSLSD